MRNTHVAAELVRGEKRHRPARRKRAGEDSLSLLLTAQAGDAQPALAPRSARNEASREHARRQTPVAIRQASRRGAVASNIASRQTVAALRQVPVSVREEASTPQNAEDSDAIRDSTIEHESFVAGTTKRHEDDVRHESGIRGETIDPGATPERGEYPYQGWFAGETQQPSYDVSFEPPQGLPSAAAQPDQLRGELRAELQELLRGQTARAAEERASASHAKSRARLASYR